MTDKESLKITIYIGHQTLDETIQNVETLWRFLCSCKEQELWKEKGNRALIFPAEEFESRIPPIEINYKKDNGSFADSWIFSALEYTDDSAYLELNKCDTNWISRMGKGETFLEGLKKYNDFFAEGEDCET